MKNQSSLKIMPPFSLKVCKYQRSQNNVVLSSKTECVCVMCVYTQSQSDICSFISD